MLSLAPNPGMLGYNAKYFCKRNDSVNQVKVAIVQAAPAFLKLDASLAREFVGIAAKQGARLVVFGEAWLPGYPAWLDYCPGAALWDHEPTKDVFAELRRNSLSIPSRESELLAQAARENESSL